MTAHDSTVAPDFLHRLPPDPYASEEFGPLFVVFRPLMEWPGYGVDTSGIAWTCTTNRAGVFTDSWRKMRLRCHKGYSFISIRRNNKSYRLYVHKLVLEAFVGLRPEGKEACHFPVHDPACNYLWNLRWDTDKANAADRKVHGHEVRGVNRAASKLTEDDVLEVLRLRAQGLGCLRISRKFGVSPKSILKIFWGETWVHVTEGLLDANKA